MTSLLLGIRFTAVVQPLPKFVHQSADNGDTFIAKAIFGSMVSTHQVVLEAGQRRQLLPLVDEIDPVIVDRLQLPASPISALQKKNSKAKLSQS